MLTFDTVVLESAVVPCEKGELRVPRGNLTGRGRGGKLVWEEHIKP